MKLFSLRSLWITNLLAIALLFPACARAQLAFTLDSPTLNGFSGQTISFSGSLTNTGGTPIFLNGDFFTLSGTDLTLDDLPFLTGAPFSLEGGATYAGSLFDITIGVNAPSQLASGTFSIIGGEDSSSDNTLATQSFQVAVNAPEPGTQSLFLLGGVAFLPIVLARRRATRS